MYPTLAEILELPVVSAGRPTVRAGRSALDTVVRWVHVSELPDPAGTLSGGELVLSIGLPADDPTTDPAAYLAGLRAAGAVGLMIELGQHLRALPEALVQAARAMTFPLIELRRTVRFVEVTEAVHARVLTEQYARLQFAQRVGRAFRGLALDRADSDRIVGEAAHLLDLPVVLEDLGHRALVLAGGDAERVLRDWTARSRQTPYAPVTETAGPEGWTTAPVGGRARRWARLVVPLRTAGDDERVPMVLAEAADALTLRALTDPDTATPATQAGDRLLADLLATPNAGRADLHARASALGLPTTGPLVVLVLPPGSPTATPASWRTPALVGTLPSGAVGVVLPCPSADAEETTVRAFVDALPGAGAVAAASAPTFAALSDALAEAAHVAEIAVVAAPAEPRVWRARDLGARGLLHTLRDDPRLLAYVEAQLGPILCLDPARRAELLRSARAFAAADGVIATFAGLIGTSRPAAYARARKLSAVLGCDLTDPAAKLSLQVAVLALETAGLGT